MEDLHERLVVRADLRVGEHEPLELGFTLEPRVGAVPEELVQIVEVGVGDRVADLVHAGDVAREAEHRAQLVAEVLVVGGGRAQVAHEVLDRGGTARLPRLGHVDGRQLDVEDLGKRLGGEQVGLAAPLEVGHEIGLGRGLAQRGTERQLVRQCEREVVALYRVEVYGLAGDLAVAVVELGEVAEADDRVTHPPRGEVHHRVADVPDLDVEHGDDATVLMVELPGVPHDRGLASVRHRRVASEPTEAELDEGIRVRLH